MNKYLCLELFDFDINKYKKISINKNEIYNQLLLYIFLKSNKDMLLVIPTLNEATDVYNSLKNYIDNVYLFPEDDIITKKAIASSPELLFMRANLLNRLNDENKKIIIVHLNSFIKKLPSKSIFKNNKIKLNIGDKINRDELINKLNMNGYKRESTVYDVSDYSVRGFVIDVFPIEEKNPIRIEFFDNEIENIRYFDPLTQKSIENINTIEIGIIKDDFADNTSSIREYLNNSITIFSDYNQLLEQEKMNLPQIKYLNLEKELFKVKDLIKEDDIFIDTINNKNFDLNIEAKTIDKYDYNKEKFVKDIKNNNGFLCTTNKLLINEIKNIDKSIKILNYTLNNGFVYKNSYYFSEFDLYNGYSNKNKVKETTYGSKIMSIDSINIGDYVVHRKSGIGIYKGITTIEKNGMKMDYLLIQYKGNDKLYLPVEDISKLYKYSSKEGVKPTINKLNSIEWTKTKLRIKDRIKNITGELLKIYKERNKATIKPFEKDDESQMIFESEFEYNETVDQLKAIEEIKRDLEKPRPMERLLCGDVGYGKTEVVFRAMYKAVINGKQVAYLCPTTLLSHQQYDSAVKRFKNYGINIDLVNRHFTNKQIQIKLNRLKEGKIDILFGTHRLLSNDVEFKDLGLLVIDEEHRFGVEQKEKIKKIKSNVHVLSISATPIPRSLQMSLVGIRDLSLIESAPKNRFPVQTYVIEYNEMLLREVILKEMSRKGQSFILYNNITNMENLVNKYKKLIPEARICYAHGKMTKNQMQDIIYDFTNKKYDVLVSTTIIENGIDIPNANTIVVIDSDRFGLSQLYQIRGRVGRSDKIAYAYLMYKKVLTGTALKRLEAIKEFTELGSGYKISMRDLAIRGAGDILGKEQAGFIDSVGVSMYLDLINEEVNGIDLDNEEDKETIPINVETHIGSEYTDESNIVIELHKKINGITNKKELNEVLSEIRDRFGMTNHSLEIYAHEKYLEKLIMITMVKVLINDNLKVVLKLKREVYEQLNIENLFYETTKISNKFNFQYKNDSILITLLKASLQKNYIYYLEELLELIYNMKFKV
ncbi:MAG: CarD family transcriptional regulator [bacterium]|nr:CarD family transcriptional regulator [bacterium]